MKYVKYFAQFLLAITCFLMFKIFGANLSSNLSGKIFEFIGPFFRSKKLIKENIKKEANYRIGFCKEVTKAAIPKLIKKLPKGIELDEERIEDLATVFPLQYLSMFENMPRRK